jgi:hypothetical protein
MMFQQRPLLKCQGDGGKKEISEWKSKFYFYSLAIMHGLSVHSLKFCSGLEVFT